MISLYVRPAEIKIILFTLIFVHCLHEAHRHSNEIEVYFDLENYNKFLTKKHCGCLTFLQDHKLSVRLGNILFMYASTMGIALQNNRSFCIPKKYFTKLQTIFQSENLKIQSSMFFEKYFIDKSNWLPGHFHKIRVNNLPCKSLELAS